LENNLTADAFTPHRIEMMQILCAQAAIALENSRLFEDTKQEIAERKRAEEILRAITVGTAEVTGADFFRSLVRHLASALQMKYALTAECTDSMKTWVRALAFWKGDDFGENFEYPLEVASPQPRIGPPPEKAGQLHQLAMMGDVQSILAQLEELEKSDTLLQPFVTEMCRLAKDYSMKKIREFLKPYLK